MFTVLIVDDDITARAHVKTLLDWRRHGFVIAGEASNGENAQAFLSKQQVDIVITDMSMPAMNGVELIQWISSQFPLMKVIGLSSYEDFQYIRQSMKHGAVDYLLKHELNTGVLLTILKQAAESIVQARKEKAEHEQLISQWSLGKQVLRTDLIKQIVHGMVTNKEQIKAELSRLEIEMETSNLVLVVVELDDYSFLREKYTSIELERILQSFFHIMEEISKDSKGVSAAPLSEGHLALVFSFGDITSQLFMHTIINGTINRIRASVRRQLNLTACYSISRLCTDIHDLQSAYEESKEALQSKFYSGKDRIIQHTSPPLIEKQEQLGMDTKLEKELTMHVRMLDRTALEKDLSQLLSRLVASRTSYKLAQMTYVEFINLMTKLAKEAEIKNSDIFYTGETSNGSPYETLQKYETIHEIHTWLLASANRLMDRLAMTRTGNDHNPYTRKAIEIIYSHYTEDISLNGVAEQIGISSSYLSKLFKEDCGVGFAEFLNRHRIERAKIWIQSGEVKLKDIVERVGFQQYNYFFKVFKQLTGMTPIEYEVSTKK